MLETNEQINNNARMWAMFCHLAGLAGFIVPVVLSGIIAPLIVWQVKKDEHPFIDEQGKEALNFQISIALYAVIGVGVCIITCIGTILIPFVAGAVYLVNLIFMIIAAIKANNGEHYRYPLCIRFIK